jgi:CheY-like chemotaxis protein
VTASSPDQTTRKKVLVVDDDAGVRLLCRTSLEAAGLEVAEAANGDDALSQVHVSPPDAILLDILMPGVSGWDVAAALLDDPVTTEIPIVFISALGEPRHRLRAFELGVADYVTKPFDADALGPTLRKVLEQIEKGERSALIAERIEVLRAELATSTEG